MNNERLCLLADGMLGRLTKWLRLLGYDVAYDNDATDSALARRARAEGRVLLTRDRELAARRGLRTLLIRSQVLEEQVREVQDGLGPPPHPALSRCAMCNRVLEPVTPATVSDRVPPYVLRTQTEFRRCPGCERVYWPGSHLQAMRSQIEKFTKREGESKHRPEQSDHTTCPQCGTRVYVSDPACATCGQPLCPRCGTAVDEVAPRCPNCELELTFTCPGCGMELLAGAEICPDCELIFARSCANCGEPLFRAPDRCPNCRQPVTHQERTTARSISRRVGTLLVRWAVCPVCSARFVPSQGPCPECGARLCPQCSLLLLPEESTCPRCGSLVGAACPGCGTAATPGAPECPTCGQPLCPDCGAAIGENDIVCAGCGAELTLVCSECGGEISPSDNRCPHCGERFDAVESS